MVFTAEPKLYIPIMMAIFRRRHDLVTPAGHEVLSAATPKKADEIERVMLHAR